MAWALFLVVAGIWAFFLLPPLWADRRLTSLVGARSQSGLGEPMQSSAPVQSTYHSPKHSGGPDGERLDRAVILARRRRALLILAGGATASLVALVVFRGPWLVGLHGAADALLIWYVVILRRLERARRNSALRSLGLEERMLETSRVRVVR